MKWERGEIKGAGTWEEAFGQEAEMEIFIQQKGIPPHYIVL